MGRRCRLDITVPSSIFISNGISGRYNYRNQAEELIDQLTMKLRLVRHLRTPEDDELFRRISPTWITESLGGMGEDGRTLVTKTDYRWAKH